MNQDVTRLQELLARVQRNAALPRFVAPAETPLIASALAYAEPARPSSAKPAPVEAAAAVVQQALPLPPPQLSTPLDASVDELLLEDPFPSRPPPPPPPAPSSSDVFEEEPIPAVPQRATTREDDVSGVMSVADYTNQEQPEELLEDDIIEMTSDGDSVSPAASIAGDLDFDDEELDDAPSISVEEPPASSSRNRIAGTMDEALARAAERIELQEGREVPLKTPPPESGPQAALPLPAGIHAHIAPDLEELLEADIRPTAGVYAGQPTAEQLGQTIDLEEARGPALELDRPPVLNEPEPVELEFPNEELEVTLPGRQFAGGYRDDLMPPPEARHDLDAHRQRFEQPAAGTPPAPESLPQYTPQYPDVARGGFAPTVVPTVTTDSYSESVSTVTVDAEAIAAFAPELSARPDTSPGPIAKFIRAEAPRPSTFLELLDASLALGAD